MALRFTLFNSNLGQLVIDKADPIDINAITQTVKRSKEINEGVLFEIILDVEFIKDARQYIKTAFEQTGGIDAEVQVTVYEYEPNLRKWEIYATGQIDFRQYELSEDRVKVNINQTGFQTRALNLIERDVDIETTVTADGGALPSQLVYTVPFHSKAIKRIFERNTNIDVADVPNLIDGDFKSGKNYVIVDLSQIVSDDIKTRQNYPTQVSQINPVSVQKYIFKLDEGGEYKFTTRPIFGLFASFNLNWIVKWFLVYGKSGSYTTTQIGSTINFNSVPSVTGLPAGVGSGFEVTVNLEAGDEVYFYCEVEINNNATIIFTPYDALYGGEPNLSFKVDAITTVPQTQAKVIFLHDAIKRCVEHITGEQDSFYSELLGRTDIGYAVDGPGGLLAVTNGNRIRQRDRQIFFSLKQLIDICNSLYCVGFGFETLTNGKQRLRLEKIDHFYNKNFKIASLGEVYNVRKRIDNSRYYNQIEYGYLGKIDIGQVNGIDEFNTVRRSAIPIKNTKNQLKVASQVKAGGYLIEYQRRLSQSNEDGKFDDDNFLVVVVRDGGGFRTKRNEGYSSITNVISPETSYNLDISPARMLRNWFKVIASSLIYSVVGKAIKFSSGEVNYEMTSTRTGESFTSTENGDVDISGIEPIWDNMIYTLDNVRMPRNVFKAIKANPFGYIEFEDQFGEVMEGFISSEGIEHDSTKGTASLQLIKVFRNGV